MTLKSLQPLQPHWPQQPLQPNFLKKHPDPDGLIITGTKMTNVGNFLWNGSSKNSIFHEHMVPFLMEAVEAIQCYFFENWLMKLKCPDTFILT